VLLADANRMTRPLVANQLRRQGYFVVKRPLSKRRLPRYPRAARNSGAVDGRPRIEAILVDISLDGLNGWEILPRLRMEPAAAGVPIVLLSVDHPNPSLPIPTEQMAGCRNRPMTRRC
jgi:CheY-like chemotaxis protein